VQLHGLGASGQQKPQCACVQEVPRQPRQVRPAVQPVACDRVLVMYDGRIRDEFPGEALTERAMVASALDIGEGAEVA